MTSHFIKINGNSIKSIYSLRTTMRTSQDYLEKLSLKDVSYIDSGNHTDRSPEQKLSMTIKNEGGVPLKNQRTWYNDMYNYLL